MVRGQGAGLKPGLLPREAPCSELGHFTSGAAATTLHIPFPNKQRILPGHEL